VCVCVCVFRRNIDVLHLIDTSTTVRNVANLLFDEQLFNNGITETHTDRKQVRTVLDRLDDVEERLLQYILNNAVRSC
jgi:hypothetical protein